MTKHFCVYVVAAVLPLVFLSSGRADESDAIKRVEELATLKTALETKRNAEQADLQQKADGEKKLVQDKAEAGKQAIQQQADVELTAIQKKADAEIRSIHSQAEPELKVAQERLAAALKQLHETYKKLGKSVEATKIADRLRRAENLLVNGSFEEGPASKFDGHTNVDLTSGSDFVGWSVIRSVAGIVDLTYFKPSDGKRCVVLPFAGGVAQTFKTRKGVSYQVHFRMAGDPKASLGAKKLQLSTAGNFSTEFVFDTTGTSPDDMQWVSNSWTFTADSDETNLEIFGVVDENYGPAIDDIVVVELKH